MTYHGKTFGLLKAKPVLSPVAETAIAETEKRLGIAFPPSLHEWYACRDAIEILAAHSNQDPPIAIDAFAIIDWQSRRLLPFRYENQGVCTWAIVLDGSDDPPVCVDVDSVGKNWQPVTPTFSEHIYACVWDYRIVLDQPGLVQAQNESLSDSTIGSLRAGFAAELETHGWPGNTQYRFIRDRAAILLWSSNDQADWFIGAADAGSLEAVLKAIWNLDSVGQALYECSEIGKNVLGRIRSSKQ